MDTPRQTSTLAIVSLVFGILGWTGLPVVGGIVAIVTGHLARGEIRREPAYREGDGLAVAGLVLGYSVVCAALLGAILLGLFLAGLFWPGTWF